ncbi:kelch domain-containing protein 10-like isoform X2 [Paramacrobiotus metropolitanus]|uniref:kelch domain-containing protein 10-like isoform X2 n=1 Tax=Paramacrobiotus metropolitanus TaxID=2943436 RepID=UPI0024457C37|nr:kelch domain-containing protein 10-like isoform X2 [Paramacrobiotus metropolitanus]
MVNILNTGKGRGKPIPRSGHRIVSDDNYVYSYGGYNPSNLFPPNGMLAELWRYNISTQKWDCLSRDGPPEAASHSMILLGDFLLIWGGTAYPWGRCLSNRLHFFHIPSKTWMQDVECAGDVPTPRYGQSATYFAGKLYIVGGTNGVDYNMDAYILNLKHLEYERIQPEAEEQPLPRYRHEVAVLDDCLFVLGGGAADMSAFSFIDICVFNMKNQGWKTVTSQPCRKSGEYPAPRKFHSAVQWGEWAYICGGHTGTDVLDDIWRLHLRQRQWERLPQELPFPVYFHAAACTPSGCMFVFGGVMCKIGDRRCNTVFKVWLTVPTLQEMVWDVVMRNLGKSLRKPKENEEILWSIKNAGFKLPYCFLKRLQ